ncbi:MAG: hypothetical protein WC959_07075 [Kiritimatiellales bacterium]
MKAGNKAFGAVLFATLFSISRALAAETLYAQNFSNNTGTEQLASAYGWKVFSRSSDVSKASRRISRYTGSKIQMRNVKALAPYGKDEAKGFYSANSPHLSLSHVPLAISRAKHPNVTLSFDLRTTAAASTARFVFKTADGWYVSEEMFAFPSTSNFQTFAVKLFGDTKFLQLDFKTGKLGINPAPAVAASEITGDIENVGFFFEPNTGADATVMRVDNFAVTSGS